MATPVGITITAHQGDFQLEISIEAQVAINPTSVLSVQMERAAKAMAVLLDSTHPSTDDEDGRDF